MINKLTFLMRLSLASSTLAAVLFMVVSTGQTAEAATNSTGATASGTPIGDEPDWGMINGDHMRAI